MEKEIHKVGQMGQKEVAGKLFILVIISAILCSLVSADVGISLEGASQKETSETEKLARGAGTAEPSKEIEEIKADRQISVAEQAISEAEVLIDSLQYGLSNNTAALLEQAGEHLLNARNARSNEDYGQACRFAKEAEIFAKNAIKNLAPTDVQENVGTVQVESPELEAPEVVGNESPDIPAEPAQPAVPATPSYKIGAENVVEDIVENMVGNVAETGTVENVLTENSEMENSERVDNNQDSTNLENVLVEEPVVETPVETATQETPTSVIEPQQPQFVSSVSTIEWRMTQLTTFGGCHPTWSPDGSKILFTGWDSSNNYDIWVMNADGSTKKQLTNALGGDTMPSWSPDGSKILFISNRNGNHDIWVMNADGSAQTQLTQGMSAFHASWSPDRAKILILGGGLWVVNTDGTNLIQLSNSALVASWSPDGSKIVFDSNQSGNWDIWVINADKSNLQQLTTNTSYDAHPSWSPDGSKVVFYSGRSSGSDIWVMNADGSNQLRLTKSLGPDEYRPLWSPDGSRIVFESKATGSHKSKDHSDIWVMNADGSNQLRLTPKSGIDRIWPWAGGWSPDGKKIVFESNQKSSMDVWLIDFD